MVAHGKNEVTPLDIRFFGAMREEVMEVLEVLGDRAKALSPAGLREAAARLTEVARFADVFVAQGLAPPSASVAVDLQEIAPAEGTARVYVRLDDAGKKKVVDLRRGGATWKAISEAVGASEGTCRSVFARTKKRAKA